MDMFSGLNPQQRKAVTADLGPVLVLAGPGSGKTRVLANRIAYLIGSLGVHPYAILAVTFTNKAAKEMEARVARLVGAGLTNGMLLGTFHGVCARILRREVEHLPYKSNFVIFDSDDQEGVVKRAIRDLNVDEKRFRAASVHAAISRAKNELILPDAYPILTYRDEVVSRIYQLYQQILINSNAMDFDDLLLWTTTLMNENPAVLEKYARRFEHVLVDEFQDTNQVQYQLLHQLSSYHKNLFVVGDEDQSIYRWRGADYRNVLRFEEDNPGALKILLEQNYRSTTTVLDAARAVIDRNNRRTPKHLFSDRGEGEKIVLHEAPTDKLEAAFVADKIGELLKVNRISGGEIAVMYRTNAQSRLLEEALLQRGIPHRVVGAQRFYGRREVKDVLAYLRLVHNPSDEISLVRAINVPPRGIGEKTLVTLQAVARQANASAGDIVLDLGRGSNSLYWSAFSARTSMLFSEFGAQLASWIAHKDDLPLPSLFDRILADIGYRAYIDDQSEEGLDRWGNVEELRRIAFEYQDRGLVEFLENQALVSDQDTLPEMMNVPTLLTLHAAKGLEFSRVFITGLDDGLLPMLRDTAEDPEEEMAEERRLFYVGMTRAKDCLYLVRADTRYARGAFAEALPSRFLQDIPGRLLRGRSPTRERGRRRSPSYATWDSPSSGGSAPSLLDKPRPDKEVTRLYRPGMRVRHGEYGEGIVLSSAVRNGDEEVDIFFEKIKRSKVFIASLARLEVLNK
ncbi:MAG TPA: UvrD-helicase domain-containing protein [Anaerolineaceae bacterium]|nr:UvrD-helicase domain-containing protein [Anaerolineaceae bacterium]